MHLNFLGLFNFTAPYLPWVLLAFSVMLGSSPTQARAEPWRVSALRLCSGVALLLALLCVHSALPAVGAAESCWAPRRRVC